jgi:hypothetical protein
MPRLPRSDPECQRHVRLALGHGYDQAVARPRYLECPDIVLLNPAEDAGHADPTANGLLEA